MINNFTTIMLTALIRALAATSLLLTATVTADFLIYVSRLCVCVCLYSSTRKTTSLATHTHIHITRLTNLLLFLLFLVIFQQHDEYITPPENGGNQGIENAIMIYDGPPSCDDVNNNYALLSEAADACSSGCYRCEGCGDYGDIVN